MEVEKVVSADKDPAIELTRGTLILTEGIWSLIRRDAIHENKSESMVARRIFAQFYGLPDVHIDPPKKRREKEVDRG